MRRFLVSFVALACTLPAQTSPKLLLTPQKLRRLKRERDRNSDRWQAFEARVQTVPDSPERGFELALYFAITGDPARGREAVAWDAAHGACDPRQAALIADWVDRSAKPGGSCAPRGGRFEMARNQLFSDVTAGKQPVSVDVRLHGLPDAAELYALMEYLHAYRAVTGDDPRQQDVAFYRHLPELFLLSLHPDQLTHPGWQMHAAALAMIALDPNLQGSQFLQGWAIEDRFTSLTGPGVAYDLLWADPYLPGVGFENMQPWLYQPETGSLVARTSWEPDACWISIRGSERQQLNCSGVVREFGNLELVPLDSTCVSVDTTKTRMAILVDSHHPGARLIFGKKHAVADPAGLFAPPEGNDSEICLSK